MRRKWRLDSSSKKKLVSFRNQAEYLSKAAELALERGNWKEAQDINVNAVKARNEYNELFLKYTERTRTGIREVRVP